MLTLHDDEPGADREEQVLELAAEATERLWIRGGFPDNVQATDDASSSIWREQFIRTDLMRDSLQLGPRIPAGLLNAAALGRALGQVGSFAVPVLVLCGLVWVLRRVYWVGNADCCAAIAGGALGADQLVRFDQQAARLAQDCGKRAVVL